MRARTVMLAGTFAFRPVKRTPRLAAAKVGVSIKRRRARKATTGVGDDGADRPSKARRGLLFSTMTGEGMGLGGLFAGGYLAEGAWGERRRPWQQTVVAARPNRCACGWDGSVCPYDA